jgi:photosystem II PsbY protein
MWLMCTRHAILGQADDHCWNFLVSTCTCRLSILLTLFVPALGWVAFNIAGGLFGQLEKMKDRQVGPEARSLRLKRSVAGAMGLGAAGLLASAQTAEASELMQIAAGDNR